MDADQIKTATRQFMSETFSVRELRDSDDIFRLGFINSLFAMQLVMFVEREFAIVVDDEDLKVENFSSLDGIASFVLSKTEPCMGLEADS